jgi:hypothetical protein
VCIFGNRQGDIRETYPSGTDRRLYCTAQQDGEPPAKVTNAQAALRWPDARPPDLHEVWQALARIVRDAHRAGDVIGRIRDLVKNAPPRTNSIDMNEAMREVIELIGGEAVKNGVSLQMELGKGLPLIQGDRVQLRPKPLYQRLPSGPTGPGSGDAGRSNGGSDQVVAVGRFATACLRGSPPQWISASLSWSCLPN